MLMVDSGVVVKVQVNFIYQLKCIFDWNCQDDDGYDVQFCEGFVELSNLDFVLEMIFWVGKCYSSFNIFSYQFDWEYIQYNGIGGGFDNMDFGFVCFDVGVYVFLFIDEIKVYLVDKGDQGYLDDYFFNLWLKKIVGIGFDLELIGYYMNCNENYLIFVEKGYGVIGIYNFDGFYGLIGGYFCFVLQYGKGLVVGDLLGKNGWGWVNLENIQFW